MHDSDDLGAAWRQAEAALPKFVERMAAANPDEEWGRPQDWSLGATSQGGGIAWVYDPNTDSESPWDAPLYREASSPALALRALAAALRQEVGNG